MVHFQLLFKEQDLLGIVNWIFVYKIITRVFHTVEINNAPFFGSYYYLPFTRLLNFVSSSLLGSFFGNLMHRYQIYNQFLLWEYQGRDLMGQRLLNRPGTSLKQNFPFLRIFP